MISEQHWSSEIVENLKAGCCSSSGSRIHCKCSQGILRTSQSFHSIRTKCASLLLPITIGFRMAQDGTSGMLKKAERPMSLLHERLSPILRLFNKNLDLAEDCSNLDKDNYWSAAVRRNVQRLQMSLMDLVLLVCVIIVLSLCFINTAQLTIEENMVVEAAKSRSRRSLQDPDSAVHLACEKDRASVLVPDLRDYRSSECQDEQYGTQARTTIILTFDNIQWLKATLRAVAKTVPESLIQEVVLAAYGNVSSDVLQYLSIYVEEEEFTVKVIPGVTKDEVEARNEAARDKRSEVLVFLQAGVIPSQGWIQPLIDVITSKVNRFALPHFDKLTDRRIFTYMRIPPKQVTVLDYNLNIGMKDTNSESLQVEVPAIRPEVFAVSSVYFRRIGMLDRTFSEDSGGVYQELSLRVWRCGGRILHAACSNVGVYNVYSPSIVEDPVNAWRIHQMWLSEGGWDPFGWREDLPQRVVNHDKLVAERRKQLQDQHVVCYPNFNTFMNKFMK